MLATLTIILPIFALIFSGWLLRKSGIVGDQATVEMNKFVVYLALPALLFDIIAHADWQTLWQPGFIACFTLANLIVLFATCYIQWRRNKLLADAAVDALNSSYANTGFMGFPLVLSVLGESALTPILISCIITVCVLFAIGIVLVELGLQQQAHPAHLLRVVSSRVLRNPLILAPLVATLVPLFDLTLPTAADTFLDLLGGSAAPCALVTLGLFLGNTPKGEKILNATVGAFVATKLIVHPLLTWLLAIYVFDLSAFATYCAVLLAALPTGTGPFMLAKYYNREASVTSGSILLSTALSPITLMVILSTFPVPQIG